MRHMDAVSENRDIDLWLRGFLRCPSQVNRPHESDSEIVEIPVNSTHLLAVTIDTLAEEIAQKLYQDPFTMGWVTVMASFSDLAAVGADPVGIVTSVSFETSWNEQFRKGIAQGMAAACRELGVYLLGGDTNTAPNGSLTGCALGLVPRRQKMMRSGGNPGDHIYVSGRVGQGNALGLAKISGMADRLFPERLYRPKARLKEGRMIRKYATCCMDTSDGLLITIDQLSRINGAGFFFKPDWQKILAPEVWAFCCSTDIPPWFMAAGIHGEFELVFTVPPDKMDSFIEDTAKADFFPVDVGTVENNSNMGVFLDSGEKVEMDMAPLRNLWGVEDNHLQKLLEEHHFWGKKWGLE